jgi:hypothetical protein
MDSGAKVIDRIDQKNRLHPVETSVSVARREERQGVASPSGSTPKKSQPCEQDLERHSEHSAACQSIPPVSADPPTVGVARNLWSSWPVEASRSAPVPFRAFQPVPSIRNTSKLVA